MTNPLPHVGQTTRLEDSRTPAEQTDESAPPAGRLPIHPTTDDDPSSPAPAGAQKPIRDLKPGEPPPESSAGS